MTRAELDAALARLGLNVPEKERDEIASAAHFIGEMTARLRPRRRRRAGACRAFSGGLSDGAGIPDHRRGGAADCS